MKTVGAIAAAQIAMLPLSGALRPLVPTSSDAAYSNDHALHQLTAVIACA